MSDRSPSPRTNRWFILIALLAVLIVGYAVLIAGQILLGVIPVLGLVIVFLLWRFVLAVEVIADAQQRIAAQCGQSDTQKQGHDQQTSEAQSDGDV